ncbi:hypothetical protein VP01_873g6 [Puccinia sorghi]|uniref:Uncharacterized protein n=1 Tax=Puccinia sorghi TaxID=27349 RepID=A0A0L6U8L3_9BASI|nr:hypothetical protein VP01_873g6 [Puccinia sorghi]
MLRALFSKAQLAAITTQSSHSTQNPQTSLRGARNWDSGDCPSCSWSWEALLNHDRHKNQKSESHVTHHFEDDLPNQTSYLLQGDNLLASRSLFRRVSSPRSKQNLVVSSRQDAFINSISDFELFEKSTPQADNDIIENDDDEGERNVAAESNWDPQELWIP